MIQNVFNTNRSDKELVFDLLSANKGIYFTGFEIKNSIDKLMTDESCTRYCRTLRKEEKIVSRPRERTDGKPFTEFAVL